MLKAIIISIGYKFRTCSNKYYNIKLANTFHPLNDKGYTSCIEYNIINQINKS